MIIEITKGEDNPVAKFFSSPTNTLDTSSLKESFRNTMREYYPVALGAIGYTEALEEKCRSLEKDRNELLKWSHAELSIQTGLVAAYKTYYDFYQENKK